MSPQKDTNAAPKFTKISSLLFTYDAEPCNSHYYFLFLMYFRYYAFNLIMPCFLVMILVILGFTLSPQAGEKIGLQISVTLAICIFLTFMNEMTPPTSEAVPLLG